VAALKRELPAYLSKCAGTTFDHTDVAEFTNGVLQLITGIKKAGIWRVRTVS
jgi:hypothetical protein